MPGYEIPRLWRLKQYKGVDLERCPHCDYVSIRPKLVCLNCEDDTKAQYQFSDKGGNFSRVSQPAEATEGSEKS